jgi:hypothetical protein
LYGQRCERHACGGAAVKLGRHHGQTGFRHFLFDMLGYVGAGLDAREHDTRQHFAAKHLRSATDEIDRFDRLYDIGGGGWVLE